MQPLENTYEAKLKDWFRDFYAFKKEVVQNENYSTGENGIFTPSFQFKNAGWEKFRELIGLIDYLFLDLSDEHSETSNEYLDAIRKQKGIFDHCLELMYQYSKCVSDGEDATSIEELRKIVDRLIISKLETHVSRDYENEKNKVQELYKIRKWRGEEDEFFEFIKKIRAKEMEEREDLQKLEERADVLMGKMEYIHIALKKGTQGFREYAARFVERAREDLDQNYTPKKAKMYRELLNFLDRKDGDDIFWDIINDVRKKEIESREDLKALKNRVDAIIRETDEKYRPKDDSILVAESIGVSTE